MLDSLASELQAELDRVLMSVPPLLRIHASHGFAIEALHEALGRAGIVNELRYCGSSEAVASLAAGGCEVAGFHVPQGEFEAAGVAHYAQWLRPDAQKLIGIATRRLGLMVAKGDPKKVYGVRDLARPDLRFINRQSGSGTRFLLDLLLQKEGVDAARVRGYEQCEMTHAAVAAYVASGMADVGFGVETPARHFKLDFVPIQTERYFLLCEERSLDAPAVRAMLAIVQGAEFKASVNRLPGYQADVSTGVVTDLRSTFPTLKGRKKG
jgi:molybdate-binding protein